MNKEITAHKPQQTSLFDSDKFQHYFDIAQKMANSTIIPKAYINKPMDILIAMEMGNQLGLSPIQSIQDIAIINGKPSIYGDGLLAIIQGRPDYEYIKEHPIVENNITIGYLCTIKRKNHDEHSYAFTIDDAKKANLWGKPGPWTQYPHRMLQMRARGFAIRNIFADALRGIKPAEEVLDEHIIQGSLIKKTQTQKMDLLLKQKGICHDDNKQNNIENNINDREPNISLIDNELLSEDNINQKLASQTISCIELVENGKHENNTTNKAIEIDQCTEEQLDTIDCLIHEKNFDNSRIFKSMKFYNVKNFNELNRSQADDMIKILGKLE